MDIYIDFNKTSVYMVLKKSPRDLPVFPRGLISLIGYLLPSTSIQLSSGALASILQKLER